LFWWTPQIYLPVVAVFTALPSSNLPRYFSYQLAE
jgi:hypothetical protein